MKRPLLIMLVILTVAVTACAAPAETPELESRVASLETQLSEKETTIQMLQSQLREREATITDLETQLDGKSKRISALEEQVAELGETAPPVELAPEPTPPAPTPEVLAHWTGMGNKTTEPIIISKAPWTIVWEFQPDEPFAPGMYINKLVVYVHRVDDIPYLEVPVNIISVTGNKAGSSYIYDKGTFYLEIDSTDGTWDIQVVGLK